MAKDFPDAPVAKTPHSHCRSLGLIPGQGTRFHILQPRVLMPQLKIPYAATKTWHSQMNKLNYLKMNEWLIRWDGRRNENLLHENQRRKWLVTNVHQGVQCYSKIKVPLGNIDANNLNSGNSLPSSFSWAHKQNHFQHHLQLGTVIWVSPDQ